MQSTEHKQEDRSATKENECKADWRREGADVCKYLSFIVIMKSVGSEAREVLVRAIVLLQNQPGVDGMLTRRTNVPIVSRFMHTYVGEIEKNVGKRAYGEF
jgi:hypothetical protein